ncbi:hypothetical protein C8R43DRAFT_955060 [Mycena crocata]|nr:hypothetical protein C8R43DRAFT_955060 [Mycena crocata]
MTRWKCPICDGRSDLRDNFDSHDPGFTRLGDIVRADDTSVALPFLRHLESHKLLHGRPLARFKLLNDPDANCGKTRPCIIVDPPRNANSSVDTTPWICLMTTLDKTRPEHLPGVYMEFAVPIYPNLGNPATHVEHIHTYPEWSGGNSGWVIPLPMTFKNDIGQANPAHWRSPEHPSGYRLAGGQTRIFQNICARKTKRFDLKIKAASFTRQVINDLMLYLSLTKRTPAMSSF